MERKLERNILKLASVWNIINGLITVLAYGNWLKAEGVSEMMVMEANQVQMTGTLLDSVYMITVSYGLLQIIIGLVNFIVVRNIRNNAIQMGFIVWFVSLALISLTTLDVFGTLFYVVLIVIYQARNKAIKISN